MNRLASVDLCGSLWLVTPWSRGCPPCPQKNPPQRWRGQCQPSEINLRRSVERVTWLRKRHKKRLMTSVIWEIPMSLFFEIRVLSCTLSYKKNIMQSRWAGLTNQCGNPWLWRHSLAQWLVGQRPPFVGLLPNLPKFSQETISIWRKTGKHQPVAPAFNYRLQICSKSWGRPSLWKSCSWNDDVLDPFQKSVLTAPFQSYQDHK